MEREDKKKVQLKDVDCKKAFVVTQQKGNGRFNGITKAGGHVPC